LNTTTRDGKSENFLPYQDGRLVFMRIMNWLLNCLFQQVFHARRTI